MEKKRPPTTNPIEKDEIQSDALQWMPSATITIATEKWQATHNT